MESSDEKHLLVHQHFSKIAHRYHHLRTTDVEPVIFSARRMKDLEQIEAIDIGCGTGRYDLLLFKYLGPKLKLTCVDSNSDMLDTLEKNIIKNGISNFTSLNTRAENIPSQDNMYDCVFTFNAIHHFSLLEFLRESARILKVGGCIFIYTRLRDQNRRNIWGRYFPMFKQKETRLYTFNRLVKTVEEVPNLHIKSIEYYKYGRISTLAQLIGRAKSHHYSTFSLYSSKELEEAIKGFTDNIDSKFKDHSRVHWFDENILFMLGKE
ncbi:class I SAM-dependent methyltransferase [Chloroflexota bacterium]